jgi:hypothetical protein
MCDGLRHARQCGIMISRSVGRAGLSPLTHASMCCPVAWQSIVNAREGATGVDPKTVRRDRPPDNPEVREEMKAIASKRRRFGYRRIGVLLERKGMIMNHKKLYRLYTEEKLGVRRRRGRKRARGSRTPMPVALRPGVRPLSVIACNHLPVSRIVGFCV